MYLLWFNRMSQLWGMCFEHLCNTIFWIHISCVVNKHIVTRTMGKHCVSVNNIVKRSAKNFNSVFSTFLVYYYYCNVCVSVPYVHKWLSHFYYYRNSNRYCLMCLRWVCANQQQVFYNVFWPKNHRKTAGYISASHC